LAKLTILRELSSDDRCLWQRYRGTVPSKRDALYRADPASPAFKLADSPFYWLARVAGRYRLDMDMVLKPIGMDVPRWRVLAILTEHEPASVTELCDHAVIRLSTMTRIVQRLADGGLVITKPRDTDGRVTEVRLTDAGRNAAVSVHAQASRIFYQGFGGFSATEVAALNDMMQRLFRNLGLPPS
jgi:DNA-binding MarR family transcriptional regulator